MVTGSIVPVRARKMVRYKSAPKRNIKTVEQPVFLCGRSIRIIVFLFDIRTDEKKLSVIGSSMLDKGAILTFVSQFYILCRHKVMWVMMSAGKSAIILSYQEQTQEYGE